MRKLLQMLALLAAPAAAFADTVSVPEPETLSLLGIGAAAMLFASWRRKK